MFDTENIADIGRFVNTFWYSFFKKYFDTIKRGNIYTDYSFLIVCAAAVITYLYGDILSPSQIIFSVYIMLCII